MVERGRKSSLLLLIRALTHPEGPISWPNDLPKPKTITLGLEFQWTDPEGHKHSVHCSLGVEGGQWRKERRTRGGDSRRRARTKLKGGGVSRRPEQ